MREVEQLVLSGTCDLVDRLKVAEGKEFTSIAAAAIASGITKCNEVFGKLVRLEEMSEEAKELEVIIGLLFGGVDPGTMALARTFACAMYGLGVVDGEEFSRWENIQEEWNE